MRILSVDDSKASRHAIARAVNILGYEFIEAGNGKEGLTILEKLNGAVDLILLDWNMPVMNGLNMLEIVKSDKRYKHIPVTMITTEVDRNKIVTALKKGAANYVMKPYTQQALIEKIMESLGMGV